jgi:hypothetical protein
VGTHIFHPQKLTAEDPALNMSLTWEPYFFFAPDAQGHVQTYRNDFLVLGYDLEKKDDQDPLRAHVRFNPGLSLGWLIYRQGDYFEKNSFRLGIGKTDLVHNILSLEPCLFFHDVFRGVTPGLRLNVTF